MSISRASLWPPHKARANNLGVCLDSLLFEKFSYLTPKANRHGSLKMLKIASLMDFMDLSQIIDCLIQKDIVKTAIRSCDEHAHSLQHSRPNDSDMPFFTFSQEIFQITRYCLWYLPQLRASLLKMLLALPKVTRVLC